MSDKLIACGDPFLFTSRQGTLGRNALRGFPFWQIDFALQRQFALTKRVMLQLRADVFNLLNHPNFGNPHGALHDPLFGTATSSLNRGLGTAGVNGGLNPVFQVGGPRSGQVVLKLSFGQAASTGQVASAVATCPVPLARLIQIMVCRTHSPFFAGSFHLTLARGDQR